MKAAKPFEICKKLVWQAYLKVKAKNGAAGIDEESIANFELNLKDNLYRLWNRTRTRCWNYDWVVEFDIKGLFDNLDHNLLMKALRHHCDNKWILLYVDRWLTAPLQDRNGSTIRRNMGTPQGGVVSPILANLFLHYAFDAWIRREMPNVLFCRYADDGLHCRSQQQAENILKQIEQRFRECGLEIHPEKSGIIYCKDRNRKVEFKQICFDFLGYTFKPRRCVDKQGREHPNFLPAISQASKKSINREIRS